MTTLRNFLKVLAITAAGCGGSTTATTTNDLSVASNDLSGADFAAAGAPLTASVGVGPNIDFAPSSTTIAKGGTVTWTWSGGLSHSVTSGTCAPACTADGKFTSDTQASGTFHFTFNTAGDFPYFCIVHGSMMTGVVHVQ